MAISDPTPTIEMRVARIALHHEDDGAGEVVHVHELPQRRTGAPQSYVGAPDRRASSNLRMKGRQDVAGGEAEIVVRPVKVGWHRRDEVALVLAAVSLAQLDAGDFGDGIPFIGGLQRPVSRASPQRLVSVLGIDAGRPEEQQLLPSLRWAASMIFASIIRLS